MTDLYRKLSLIVVLIFAFMLSVNADDSIFKNKKKARSEGPKLTKTTTYCVGDSVTFGITITDDPLLFPIDFSNSSCDLHMGIKIGDNLIQYVSVVSEEYEEYGNTYYQLVSNFTTSIPEQECHDGEYTISFDIDLYCKDENGDFSSFNPCNSNLLGGIIQDKFLDECSLLVEDYSISYPCCTTIPDPQTSDDPSLIRNRKVDNNVKNVSIYSLDGKVIHQTTAIKEDEVANILQSLPIASGLYVIITNVEGKIKSKKYFKNPY